MILFVYGTLTSPHIASQFLERTPEMHPAELEGYKKVRLNIVKDPNHKVSGVKMEVSEYEMGYLDIYEGVLYNLYKRIDVKLKDGTKAIAYQKCDPKTVINFE